MKHAVTSSLQLVLQIALPETVRAAYSHRKSEGQPELGAILDKWTDVAVESTLAGGVVESIYNHMQTRIAGLEAKAVGLLQGTAIVGAVAAVAVASSSVWATILGVVSLLYVLCVVLSAAWVLRPRARDTLTADDATSTTNGYAEMLAIVERTAPLEVLIANYADAAFEDLVRAFPFALVGLIVAM